MTSKLTLLALALSFGLVAQGAESTVTVSGVHNCCKSCENGITNAVASVQNARATVSGRTVTITVKNKSDAKKAVAALADAGYYGKAEGVAEKPASASSSASAPKMVKSATVSSVHMCCQKCVDAAEAAVKSVAGVTANTLKPKVTSFTVTGEFDVKALEAALNEAGFGGKVK